MIVIVVVLVVAAAAVAGVVVSRHRAGDATAPQSVSPPERVRPTDVPMTGLESALAEVTDREGRPIGDRIDAESGHVDELRVPDDTGPLLRRALDHVVHEPTEPASNDPLPRPGPDAPVPDAPQDERDLGPPA